VTVMITITTPRGVARDLGGSMPKHF